MRHQPECRAFTEAGKKAGRVSTCYPLVMPLRVLAQMAEEAGLEERLAGMMDHRQERQEAGHWQMVQDRIVSPLFDLGLDLSAEQVQRCVGLFRTNGCELRGTGLAEGEEHVEDCQLGRVRALFPTMSTMSHSCLPNTRMLNSLGYRIIFRTVRKVQGEDSF